MFIGAQTRYTVSSRGVALVVVCTLIALADAKPAGALAGEFTVSAGGKRVPGVGSFMVIKANMTGWKLGYLEMDVEVSRDGAPYDTYHKECTAASGCTQLTMPDREIPCNPGEVFSVTGTAYGPDAEGGLSPWNAPRTATCPGEVKLEKVRDATHSGPALARVKAEKDKNRSRQVEVHDGQGNIETVAVPQGVGTHTAEVTLAYDIPLHDTEVYEVSAEYADVEMRSGADSFAFLAFC